MHYYISKHSSSENKKIELFLNIGKSYLKQTHAGKEIHRSVVLKCIRGGGGGGGGGGETTHCRQGASSIPRTDEKIIYTYDFNKLCGVISSHANKFICR